MPDTSVQTVQTVPISATDLPLHCPLPGDPLWARHPRVFLDISQTGSVSCPYCGTHYALQNPKLQGHRAD